MATEKDIWTAIRQVELPADKPLEVVATPPGPWGRHLLVEVYEPGGHGCSCRVTEDDDVDTLVAKIDHLIDVVHDADDQREILLAWKAEGDRHWDLWRTASHIEWHLARGLTEEEIEAELELDPREWILWMMRIQQNPGTVAAANRLRLQEERERRRAEDDE